MSEQVRSYKCKTCGKVVKETDFKTPEDFESMRDSLQWCGPCYYHPGNWGNE